MHIIQCKIFIQTTVTNGVSFELVSGACCFINFTAASSRTANVSTLNINSTGSKTLQKNMFIRSASNISSSIGYNFIPCVVCYTGSAYIGCMLAYDAGYHYNDSDS